jgi:integrase
MGRGHVRARGDAWEVRISAGSDPLTGARRVITRTVRGSKADANRALTALLAEHDQGAHRGPDATLGTLLDRWWAHGRSTWAPNTRRGYAAYRRHYLADHHDRRLADVTPEWLDRLYASLLERLAPATVYKIHTMIHDALADAVRWGWLAWNPADRAQPPKVRRRPLVVPDANALRSAIDRIADDDPDFATLLHLQAVAGLRPAELCGLQWGDLGDTLAIGRTVVMDEHRRITVAADTKTHEPRRIPLDPATLGLLEAHRLRWKDHLSALDADLEPGHFLFPRSTDPAIPAHPQQLTRRWARRRDALGLPGVRLYDFRHAMVTRLLDAGIPVHDVAARAGHDPAMTLRRYSHPSTEGGRRAGDAAGL